MRTFKFILGALLPLFFVALLAHAGSIIQPASGGGVPTSQQAGWITAWDCNYDTQPTATFGATFTACGITGHAVLSGGSGLFLPDAGGLFIKAAATPNINAISDSMNSDAGNTTVRVFYAMSDLVPTISEATAIRVTVWASPASVNAPANGDYCATQIEDGYKMMAAIGQWKNGAAVPGVYVGSSRNGTGGTSIGIAANDTPVMRMTWAEGLPMFDAEYQYSSDATNWAFVAMQSANFGSFPALTTYAQPVTNWILGHAINNGTDPCVIHRIKVEYQN